MGINTTLHSAKPSFANHKMFKSELGEDYVIAAVYNGLKLGGGSYTPLQVCSLATSQNALPVWKISRRTSFPMSAG